eukprot:3788174-Alexandrium_andersonii.AAC.1
MREPQGAQRGVQRVRRSWTGGEATSARGRAFRLQPTRPFDTSGRRRKCAQCTRTLARPEEA